MTRHPYTRQPNRGAAVRRYFRPTPARQPVAGPVLLWLLGLALIGFGISAGAAAGIGAGVGAAAGGTTVYLALGGVLGGALLVGRGGWHHFSRARANRRALAWAEPKASDWQMDEWLYTEGKSDIIHVARQRLHLVHADEAAYMHGGSDADPLVIYGLPDDSVDYLLAYGRDGQLRSTHYDIIVFFLTKWHLCVYRCLFEMEHGYTLTDETKEFAYRDLVSLATMSDRVTTRRTPLNLPLSESADRSDSLPRQEVMHFTTQQWFRLRVASDEIETMVGIHYDEHLGTGEFGGGSDVERTLQQIRAKLREYTERREERDQGDDFHRGL
ncbi:hypothetical protein [Streptomyces hiroshimensis]|uniref:DUF3137 domain-containing protein n=1 Tax=Streptomyces hiroshimensis TaxID=66424 RepID=A0ABQ2Z5G4_9ACTN|nr:hypothetical protein [Streptomyces hiroshimensis]GGY05707.1 hypothetical protein GCM10010324_60660 [Streptomyces hiroshimensis]